MPTHARTLCAMLLVAARGSAPAQSSAFEAEGKQLAVTTGTVEVVIAQGVFRHIRDLRTGEVFVVGDAVAIKEIPSGFSSVNDLYWFRRWWTEKPDRYAGEAEYQGVRRRPTATSRADVKQLSPTQARLVYGGLSNGDTRDTLTYDLRIDSATGEILLQATAEVADPAVAPVTVEVPIVGFRGPSAILGSGAKYNRGEPRIVDCTTRVSNGLYSPNMAILQGKRGCIAVWAEAHRFEPANVYLAHRESDDTLILNGTTPYGGLASAADSKVLKSPVWRIGAFPTWVDAARRYRELLEERTGARPLWEHPCRWVRGIHAVDTNVPLPKQAGQYYDELAKRVDPGKLLLFYWNGSYIVLFGDHRYQKATRTKPGVIAALKKRGFRWMGYHPYTLLMPQHVMDKRLKDIAARGHLPEGYTFQPDYGGPPEQLYDYFRPIATGYYKPIDEARLWVLHAGTKRFQDYWARNFGSYCKTHEMDGAYMDILGCNGGHQFPPEKKVMEGLDWREGEAAAMKALRERLPDRTIMSEYQTEVTLSHAFYSWTGTGHVTRTKEVGTRLNHPLRTALWGSYTWTRADGIDPVGEALIGGLPPMRISVGKDGKVAEDEWRTAVCRLFAEEELFNDLPIQWDDDILACYRGREGKWFQFRELPFGDGYVEITDEGYQVRAARFRGQNEGPLDTPVEIQQWVGYRNGKAIGLTPERTYPFLTKRAEPDGTLWITDLPKGAFINAVRHSKSWSVVELGSTGARQSAAKVTAKLHRRCLRICAPDRDVPGPFGPDREVELATPAPGGLVFIWEEPAPSDSRFRSQFIAAAGRVLAHGVPDRFWSFNGHIRTMAVALDGTSFPAVSIGQGRYRGYAEQWFELTPEVQPTLKFDVGYPLPSDQQRRRRSRPMQWSVHVNGAQVWSERIEPAKGWRPREVPLASNAGRKVLITLSAEEVEGRNVRPSHLDQPSLFGRVRIDNNPLSLDPVDGSSLPKPKQILFADSFEGAALDGGWATAISPANGAAGRLSLEGGRLCLTGQHYKYAYLSRALSADNISAQARIQMFRTGCDAGWNPGVGLWWNTERYCFMTGGGYRGGDEIFVIRGCGARRIPLGKRKIRVRDDNRYDFWVKIALTKSHILYFSSLDGKSWHKEAEIGRRKELAGPPQLLIVGRGAPGEAKCFSNDAKWRTGVRKSYVDEVVVGNETE